MDPMLPATGADLPIWLFVTIAIVAIAGGGLALMLGRRRRGGGDPPSTAGSDGASGTDA